MLANESDKKAIAELKEKYPNSENPLKEMVDDTLKLRKANRLKRESEEVKIK